MPWASKIHNPLTPKQQEQERRQRRAAITAGDKLHNTKRARHLSREYLSANPLCVKCKAKGHIKASQVWDHIVPHRGNERLFLDPNNWQALCISCHNTKTSTTDRRR